ncbi:MAG: hypothetical protein IK024_02855 [Treponema sp.]|nr:hypothetical protein [Treponema sp.]
MTQDVLTVAWKLMRRRKFATAIKLLEAREEIYEGNFEYYILLGTACLYVGDIGSAVTYFGEARKIKISDVRLLLGQAAIFLRRGDTDRALQYYMEIKDIDPANKISANAVEFIRTRGDYDTICRWVDTGRIEQFYPPLGVNPEKVASIAVPAFFFVAGVVLVLVLFPHKNYYKGERRDLTELSLTADEKNNLQEKDLSAQAFGIILNDKQISKAYLDAMDYFQSHRDNAAQVEINRILNSNASVSVKQKARILMSYLEEPTFDTLTDNPSYTAVEAEPALYLDAWVSWGGKITNAYLNENGTYSCQLLVGYESGEVVEGIVNVRFAAAPNIMPDQPVKILGKICSEDKKIYLEGKAIYQSIKDGLK